MNSKFALVFLVLVHALAIPAVAGEAATSRYTAAPATPDGIGKVYLGREIGRS